MYIKKGGGGGGGGGGGRSGGGGGGAAGRRCATNLHVASVVMGSGRTTRAVELVTERISFRGTSLFSP